MNILKTEHWWRQTVNEHSLHSSMGDERMQSFISALLFFRTVEFHLQKINTSKYESPSDPWKFDKFLCVLISQRASHYLLQTDHTFLQNFGVENKIPWSRFLSSGNIPSHYKRIQTHCFNIYALAQRYLLQPLYLSTRDRRVNPETLTLLGFQPLIQLLISNRSN